MAINEAVGLPFSAAQKKRNFERKAVLLVLGLLVLATLAGFGPTYYFKLQTALSEYRLITSIHAALMVAWIAVFALQIYLVRRKLVAVHMKLGMAAIALAVLLVVVGYLTAVSAAKFGTAAAPAEISPLSFLIVPFGDIVLFAIFFAAAVYYRKQPTIHKRMMLLTAFNFMPAAVARVPIASLQSLGPVWFFGFPDLMLIILLVFDTWRNRRLEPAFALGALLLIASHPIRLAMMESETWLAAARWMTGG
ncbi:MAG: hypothetical protein IPM21_06960 [Acidobacteria bacterium]|nr:hypothetical protein [Acidobacteriota bacterium]